MKKTLNVLLVALTVIALAVSCSPSPLDDDVKGVVSFSIEEPKSVITEVLTYQFSEIHWYLSAHKADSSLWKTGATHDSYDLEANDTVDELKVLPFIDALTFGKSMTFSKGSWNMAIQGRLADGTVVYQSAAKAVNVVADKETTVDFAVDNVLPKGQIQLVAIYASFGVAEGDPAVTPYDGTELEIEALVDGDALTLSGTGEKGDYDFTYSKVDKEIVSTGEHAAFFFLDPNNDAVFELEDGVHTLTLNVYPKDATHSAENIASTGSVTFAIYHGYKVLIGGDLTNLDETGTVVIEQNVAKVGPTFYKSLEAAFAAATDGSKIELLSNIPQLKKVIEIGDSKKLTLDLNYFSITSSVSPVFKLTNGAELTIYGGEDSEIKTTAVGGDAIIINGCGVTQKSGKISSVDCQKGFYTLEGGEVDTIKVAKDQSVTLSGGKVKTKIEAAKGANVELGNVDVTGATCAISEATVTFTEGAASESAIGYAVARIGNNYYPSLAEAIVEVKDKETIYVLKDTEAQGLSVNTGITFTVDFGKHTYTVNKPGAGSTGTTTQGFQLLAGQSITFKNGTIKVAESNEQLTWASDAKEKGIAMVIQNYCNLTLDNMVIDGTNMSRNGGSAVRYTISNNSGTVLIKDSTIKAKTNSDVAFDVCKYGTYSIPEVTVEGNSQITGVVELSGGHLIVNGGKFKNEAWYGVRVLSGTMDIYGGEFEAQESCLALFGDGDSETTIYGGKFTSKDNFVVGNQGLEKYKAHKTNLTINGGEFIGNITSSGYIACGIYWCNNGDLTVNGGKFTITNGCVLALKAGELKGFKIASESTYTGSITGKVGDAGGYEAGKRIVVNRFNPEYPAGAPVFDTSIITDADLVIPAK